MAWIVGGESNGARVSSVQMIRPDRAFGTAGAPGAGSPYFGDKLLVADRGNNRLLLLDAAMNVVWKYPSPSAPRDKLGFYFPDDAFFTNHGTAIISNQEENETIVKIAYPSERSSGQYGHPGQPGTAKGYLHEPDDAYLLKNGQVTVADAVNCRVLVINENHTVARPDRHRRRMLPQPARLDGLAERGHSADRRQPADLEINGSWVSEYTLAGKLVWTRPPSGRRVPVRPAAGRPGHCTSSPITPRQGRSSSSTAHGKILYRYDHPRARGSSTIPRSPNCCQAASIMANDDHNDRMVAIDPSTGALVWQYGITGKPGTGPGQLNIPDGFDLLLPDGSTPTHPATG